MQVRGHIHASLNDPNGVAVRVGILHRNHCTSCRVANSATLKVSRSESTVTAMYLSGSKTHETIKARASQDCDILTCMYAQYFILHFNTEDSTGP